MAKRRYIRFFDEIGIDDIPLVGGKNASLGEMFQAPHPRGAFPFPNGLLRSRAEDPTQARF